MSFEREVIVVDGAQTLVGAEVARLAVALGHEVLGIARGGAPSRFEAEPWCEGVRWIEDTATASTFHTGHRVVFCGLLDQEAPELDVEETLLARLEPWHARPPEKLVIVSHAAWVSAALEAELFALPCEVALLYAGLCWGVDRALHEARAAASSSVLVAAEAEAFATLPPQRAERVAMAALRASLEEDRRGVFSREAIEVLGDAMMIQ